MYKFSKLLPFFFCKDGSDRLMKWAPYSCCIFLCVVLTATYLKYRWYRLSFLPFVWHFFFHCDTHTSPRKWESNALAGYTTGPSSIISKKKKKKKTSGRRPVIAFLYFFLFRSLLRFTSFCSRIKNLKHFTCNCVQQHVFEHIRILPFRDLHMMKFESTGWPHL